MVDLLWEDKGGGEGKLTRWMLEAGDEAGLRPRLMELVKDNRLGACSEVTESLVVGVNEPFDTGGPVSQASISENVQI